MYYLPLRFSFGPDEKYERVGTLTMVDPMILGAGNTVENYLKLNFNFKDIPPSGDDFLNSEAKRGTSLYVKNLKWHQGESKLFEYYLTAEGYLPKQPCG